MTATKPITVNKSRLPATAAAGLRYLISLGGTYAVANGWVDPEHLPGLATSAVTLATVAYGLYRTNTKHGELIAAADAAPDRVARVV